MGSSVFGPKTLLLINWRRLLDAAVGEDNPHGDRMAKLAAQRRDLNLRRLATRRVHRGRPDYLARVRMERLDRKRIAFRRKVVSRDLWHGINGSSTGLQRT